MIKKYIILTGAIRNAGGAQLYTANKLSYMESLGWKPYAFFHVAGDVKIGYLTQFVDGFIPELGTKIQALKQSTVERVFDKISRIVGTGDEVIIESNGFSLTFWGEMIAERLNGKNVLFPLEESLWNITRKEASFLEFKLHRNEIMTATEIRLKQMFQKYYKSEYRQKLLGLKAYCSNVVDYSPIELPQSIVESESFKILSIGRLKKAYINPMLQDVKLFADTHKEKLVSLIMVGGDNDPSVEANIKELFKDTPNVVLYLLGYIFPIPYDWIKISDVCIASSNSVVVSADEGIPTIAIDALDLMAMGIYGYTTNNKVFRQDEPLLSTCKLLEEILIEKKYPKVLKQKDLKDEFETYFQPHVAFLDGIEKEKKYYKLSDIYSPLDCIIARIKSVSKLKI